MYGSADRLAGDAARVLGTGMGIRIAGAAGFLDALELRAFGAAGALGVLGGRAGDAALALGVALLGAGFAPCWVDCGPSLAASSSLVAASF